MRKTTTKLWIGLGTVALLGAGAAQAADHGAMKHGTQPLTRIAATQGGEGGEGGEAGHEHDAFAKVSAAEALVGRLLLLKGHLMVGWSLYEAGRTDAAAPHFLHPTEEIYESIKKPLSARKIRQFDKDLTALATLVKQKKPAAEVGAKQAALLDTVDKAIAKAGKAQPSFVMAVLPSVLDQAQDEYKEAIENGRIANAVEYQDAHGFVLASRDYAAGHAKALGARDAAAQGRLTQHLDELAKAFPSAVPPQSPAMEHGAFQATVSRIELLKGSFR